MSGKFSNVPVEPGTSILHRDVQSVRGYSVLVEIWHWSGITANSAIFAEEDVADLDDESIINLARELPVFGADSEITFTRDADGYTFVNFNFFSD